MNLFSGSNRYGTLINDDLVVPDHPSEFIRDPNNVAQIGRAVPARRGRKCKENQHGVSHSFGERSREGKSARIDVALKQHIEVGFVNRNIACLHGGDFLCVNVDADHVVARLRETCPCDEAHISGSNYRYLHCFFIGP